MVALPLSFFAVWRMKANAIEGHENKFNDLPFYKKLVSDFIIPKSLLTERGKQWYIVGQISGIALIIFFAAYIYLSNQSWVCPMGPKSHPIEKLKNVYKGS